MFRQPLWLLAAAAAPVLALALRALAERRRQGVTRLLGEPATVARLLPAETAGRRGLRALLRAAGAALLGLSLAGPQWGVELVSSEAKARSVIVAVDVSASMAAEDVRPNRLEKAKEQLSVLLDGLKGDRVGVVAFAGEAALVCPVTTDLEAAKGVLRALEPGLIPVPGTAIGKAIRLASESLDRYPGGKALVVLSDGEDQDTDPQGAADDAAARGVRIFGIGVGTPDGGPIPARDEGGNLSGYKKDKSGATVVSRLGERTLADVAARASGAYYRASPSGDEAVAVAEQIRALDTSKGGGASASARFKNRYLLPLWLAFFVLLAEALVRERAGRALLAVLALAVFLPAPGRAATAEGELRRGNSAYEAGRYDEALERYGQAQRRRPKDPRPVFNAGAALHRLDRNEQAADAFAAVAGADLPAPLRAAASYNRGNALFSDGRYGESVEAYRKALSLSPGDEQARRNLAIALRFLKNPPPPRDKKEDKNKPKDDKSGGQDKPKDSGAGGGQDKPQAGESRTRPQERMTREDAERVLRAVGENERRRAPRIELGKEPPKKADVERDW